MQARPDAYARLGKAAGKPLIGCLADLAFREQRSVLGGMITNASLS
jgi:hypothetical protein